MVRIRMQRGGRRHVNYFRINAIEKRVKRDGQVLENLGWYNPQAKDKAKQSELNVERIKHWLSVGAQPSDTIKDILAAQNLIDAPAWKTVRQSRAKAAVAARAMVAANPQPDPNKKKEPKAEAEKKPA